MSNSCIYITSLVQDRSIYHFPWRCYDDDDDEDNHHDRYWWQQHIFCDEGHNHQTGK